MLFQVATILTEKKSRDFKCKNNFHMNQNVKGKSVLGWYHCE